MTPVQDFLTSRTNLLRTYNLVELLAEEGSACFPIRRLTHPARDSRRALQ